jgi:nucleoside-diphosphate-sugar epimerase
VSKVLVIGGAGYCGSVVVPRLIDRGWEVTVYDILWYGRDHLPVHSRLKVIPGDVRDIGEVAAACAGQDAVLHLACISNDASFELDERLSTSVNFESFEPTVVAAKAAGVRRFVFVSSSSVYGVSKAADVTEEHPLLPLTLYNKYKGLCEPRLLAHTDTAFVGAILRPATVCGPAPRQRLDLSVNILTNHAVNRGRITVFGGAQLRPHLHIQDYAAACERLLSAADGQVANQIFNVGVQNMSILELAQVVKGIVENEFPEKGPITIDIEPCDDPRSYHINSDRIRFTLGFVPHYSVEDAVRGLCHAFRAGALPGSLEDDRYYNVRTMKVIGAR